MSSSKRRKVESQDVPQTDATAISAIAARRRLAGRAASSQETPGSPERRAPNLGGSNAFSVLQSLSRQGDTPSQSTPANGRTPRGAGKSSPSPALKRNGDQRDSTGSEGFSNITSPEPVQFSSFRPSKRNYRVRSDGVTELKLDESERFLVLGSFGVRVLEGEVTVAGASLRPDGETYWVHAPHCHSLPVLRTKENTRMELHSDPNALTLRRLGRLSPLFRKIWNEPPEIQTVPLPPNPTFQILCSSNDAPRKCIIQDLVSPPEWNKKLSSLTTNRPSETFTTLVCGPKSSGKSTFSRILVNRLLTRGAKGNGIALLDLDPGQPEYTPPGTLSLVHVTKPNLGASFMRVRMEDPSFRVLRCHALASVSPALDPDRYRDCAFNLYAEYRKTLGHIPLLINTPGWILGTGLELLDEFIETTSPSEVIYMSEEGPAETVDVLQKAAKNAFSTLPSQPAEFTARTGAHLRAMHSMSYFHSKPSSASGATEWDPTPLSAVAPCHVRYSGKTKGILGILSYDYQPPLGLLADTINGIVLAVVEIESPKAYRGLIPAGASAPTLDATPENIPFIRNSSNTTLDPQYSRTIGLALIKGIDTSREAVQLVTPVPVKELQSISKSGRDIVLVRGRFDTPNWAFTEDLHLRSADEDLGMKSLELAQGDTSDDDSDVEPAQNVGDMVDVGTVPWVEILAGNEKRPVGSKVWRVRRDLGKNAGD